MADPRLNSIHLTDDRRMEFRHAREVLLQARGFKTLCAVQEPPADLHSHTILATSNDEPVAGTYWLSDPKRVYPVSIDPTYVREYTNVAGAGATYITTNAPDTGHFGADPLLSGWNDAGAGTNRTFIKYPIDGVPAHSRIVGATMWVYETWSWS